MKQNKINGFFEFLGQMQMNKISDKNTKMAFIKMYDELYKKVKDFREEVKAMQDDVFKDNPDALAMYENAAKAAAQETDPAKISEIENGLTPEVKELVVAFTNKVNESLSKDIPVTFEKVEKDKFVEALIDLNIEFTCGDLIILNDLYTE